MQRTLIFIILLLFIGTAQARNAPESGSAAGTGSGESSESAQSRRNGEEGGRKNPYKSQGSSTRTPARWHSFLPGMFR